jgi:transposase
LARNSVSTAVSVSTAKSPSPRSPSRIKLVGEKPEPSSKGGLRVREQQYVGVDLHRRRSVIVRMNDAGEVVGVAKIDNDPLALAMAVAEAGPDPEVALEACYGWYWAADLLAAEGARVHLVHPLGLHWDSRRVKNDVKDATELANRLRRNDVPEAWIAPPEVRDLRELVRYRAKLVALRTSAKAQIHAVMAKLGIIPPMADMFCASGQVLLDDMDFPGPYGLRVESLRDLLESYNRELVVVERWLHRELKDHAGYRAIQVLHGVGPISAAIFVAEIGDVSRFPTARHLCSWAGMTPKLHESDTKSHKGRITKQGSTIVRWAAVEAVARYNGGEVIAPTYRRIAERRGKMIARVAAARKLLTLIYYGLRDGEIRCLYREAA